MHIMLQRKDKIIQACKKGEVNSTWKYSRDKQDRIADPYDFCPDPTKRIRFAAYHKIVTGITFTTVKYVQLVHKYLHNSLDPQL